MMENMNLWANLFANFNNFNQSGMSQTYQEPCNERVYDLSNIKDVNEILQIIANNSQTHRPQNVRRR